MVRGMVEKRRLTDDTFAAVREIFEAASLRNLRIIVNGKFARYTAYCSSWQYEDCRCGTLSVGSDVYELSRGGIRSVVVHDNGYMVLTTATGETLYVTYLAPAEIDVAERGFEIETEVTYVK